MREYIKAIEAVQEAAEHDDAKAHTKEIREQILKCQQAQFSQREGESDEDVMNRALRDPEVAVRIFPSSPPLQLLLTITDAANYGRSSHAIDSAASPE
jgi:stress-induced-phosphoprotein 1